MKVSQQWLTSQNISIFKQFKETIGQASIFEVIAKIKRSAYKAQVEAIRYLYVKGKKDEADTQKMKLTAVTFSAWCVNGRTLDKVQFYTKYICLDLDSLSEHDLKLAKAKVVTMPETLAAFISPKGNGLKIIVMVDTELEEHKNSYKQVLEHYQKEVGHNFDAQTSDAARLCFLSYDPEAFLNPEAKVFGTVGFEPEPVILCEVAQKRLPCHEEQEKRFFSAKSFTENKQVYSEGNRNTYMHWLSRNCIRQGIYQNKTIEFVFKHLNITQSKEETIGIIKRAYANGNSQFDMLRINAELKAKSLSQSMETSPIVTKSEITPEPNLPTPVCEEDNLIALPDQRKLAMDLINAAQLILKGIGDPLIISFEPKTLLNIAA